MGSSVNTVCECVSPTQYIIGSVKHQACQEITMAEHNIDVMKLQGSLHIMSAIGTIKLL